MFKTITANELKTVNGGGDSQNRSGDFGGSTPYRKKNVYERPKTITVNGAAAEVVIKGN